MDPKELFAKAVQQATSCVRHVGSEHFNKPTPCSEWNVRALLNHMVYELLWVPELIKGKTIQEVGDRFDGDVVRSDAKNSWQHAADAALVAVHSAKEDTKVHLSSGDVPVTDYIQEVGNDIFIHSWDLAQGIGCTLLFPEEVAKAVYDNLLAHQDEREDNGAFGPPVEVPTDADTQTKLLGLTGRRTKWQAD